MAIVRFKWWTILFIGSIVLVFSILERGSDVVVGIVLGTISTVLSFLGVISSVIPLPIRGCRFRLESLLIWIVTTFWGATAVFSHVLPTSSEESIDVNLITHSNQFLFGYLCLMSSVVLLSNWFKHEVQLDNSVTSPQWILLCASSFIVMISAIGFRDRRLDIPLSLLGNETSFSAHPPNITFNPTLIYVNGSPINLTHVHATTNGTETIQTSLCEVSEAFNCRRVNFAVILGGLSAVCSLTTALVSKSCSPTGCVIDLALLFFVAWCCGIAFLTFARGPGFALGSIYFGTFISMFLCLDILLVSLCQQAAIERERDLSRNENYHQRLANEHQSEGAEEFEEVSLDDVLSYSLQGGRRFSRRRTHGSAILGSDLKWTKSTDYRGKFASIYESVGAWRGSAIHNMEGERIPSDIAHPFCIQELDAYVEKPDIRRIELWLVLLITSIVGAVAIWQLLPVHQSRKSIENLVLAMPLLSCMAAVLGIVSCGRPGRKARLVELTLIALSVTFWIITLICGSLILDSGDITMRTDVVLSANVFCCSWGSFVVSILLCCSWFRASMETIDWTLLCVFSTAFFASSVLFYNEEIFIEGDDISIEGRVCDIMDSISCTRVRFGIYLGLVTALISSAMVCLNQKMPQRGRLVIGGLLFVSWSCAVAFTTFGKGYGKDVGSLYLQVWCSFFSLLDIMNSQIVLMLRKWYERSRVEERLADVGNENDQEQEERGIVNDTKDNMAGSPNYQDLELPDSLSEDNSILNQG